MSGEVLTPGLSVGSSRRQGRTLAHSNSYDGLGTGGGSGSSSKRRGRSQSPLRSDAARNAGANAVGSYSRHMQVNSSTTAQQVSAADTFARWPFCLFLLTQGMLDVGFWLLLHSVLHVVGRHVASQAQLAGARQGVAHKDDVDDVLNL